MDAQKPLRHLRIDGYTKSEKYRPPPLVIAPPSFPVRDRKKHGKALLDQVSKTEDEIETIIQESATPPAGFNLVLNGEKSLAEVLKSLDAERQGIELANVRTTSKGIEATVFVPQGRLVFFRGRIEKYLDPVKDTKKGEPANAPLVTSISEIGLAALKHFWTDSDPLPGLDTSGWWEVWIRSGLTDSSSENLFRHEATSLHLAVSPAAFRFPDRAVLLVFGPLRSFHRSFHLLDVVAEIRRAKECPTEYRRLAPSEQAAWANNLLRRVQFDKKTAATVCVLDSGMDRGNPLLSPFTDAAHVLTCLPEGNAADHDGHGTEVGGLALYGDLAPVVQSKDPVQINHTLESVKILPASGKNHPDNYGVITEQAVYRIEAQNPSARRAFCLAVTTTDFRDRGQPSAWSGALDKITFGENEDGPKRLVFVAAGNTDPVQRHQYPDANTTDGIHDPAQAWNAVTVGAFADRVAIHDAGLVGWQPVAQTGELCPASTTSAIWNKIWPLKPDIVLEGGNSAREPGGTYADSIDDLSILTTGRMNLGKVFSLSGDTSAATALAARMGAEIHAAYPEYWPETVRALLIHSAEWSPAMLRQFPGMTKKTDVENRLRCVGFGVPSLQRALWCAGNHLTLVSQQTILPFQAQNPSAVKLNNINLHEIPWPAQELLALGEAPVTMRVTLSYFIEPSPGRRGYVKRHRYASHGLRFEVIRPHETADMFRKRLNHLAREEDENGKFKAAGQSQNWILGPKLRSKGSVHSDSWTGTAADLADCNVVGVFPVAGWWKERPKFERWKREVRYSLVISITTAEQTVNLYTPVEIKLATPIPI